MNIDRNLLSQFRYFYKPLIGTLAAGWLGGGLIIIQAFIISTVISNVFIEDHSLESVLPLMRWLGLVILLRTASAFLQNMSARNLGLIIKSRLRKILFSKILQLGPLNFREGRSGGVTTLAIQGIDSLDAYFSQYIPQLILAAVIPITILFTVFPVDLLSAVILLVTAPLIPVFMILIGKSAENATKRQWHALGRMGNYFLDTIQGLVTLKLYDSARESEKIAAVSEKYGEITLNVLRITFLSALVLEMVATISTAIVAVQIGLRLLNGNIQFQPALFLLVIAPEFYAPLRALGLRFHAGITAASVSKPLFEILHREPFAVPEGSKQIQPQDAAGLPLRFDCVSFTYPERNIPALHDVSFVLQPGKITALLGASGSGKSTVYNLLLRFIDLQNGDITIGDRSIRSIAPENWRKMIAWVPQSPFLFNASITENIHMDANISQQRVQWAAREANLHDFINSLPNGYDTPIGDSGYRLSSGQAQRIALARAFYRDAPLLFLDEPTAYIDPGNANQIRDAIQRLSQSRTTLIIAHHETTLRQAHFAVMLQQGQVVAAGESGMVLDTYLKRMALEEVSGS